MTAQEMETTVTALTAPGKGILQADEAAGEIFSEEYDERKAKLERDANPREIGWMFAECSLVMILAPVFMLAPLIRRVGGGLGRRRPAIRHAFRSAVLGDRRPGRARRGCRTSCLQHLEGGDS